MAEGQAFFRGFALVINAIPDLSRLSSDARVQGKAVGGGVGLAAAVEFHCFATQHAAVKLSEFTRHGSFVVGPAVERKLGGLIPAFFAVGRPSMEIGGMGCRAWVVRRGV